MQVSIWTVMRYDNEWNTTVINKRRPGYVFYCFKLQQKEYVEQYKFIDTRIAQKFCNLNNIDKSNINKSHVEWMFQHSQIFALYFLQIPETRNTRYDKSIFVNFPHAKIICQHHEKDIVRYRFFNNLSWNPFHHQNIDCSIVHSVGCMRQLTEQYHHSLPFRFSLGNWLQPKLLLYKSEARDKWNILGTCLNIN